MTQDFIFFLLPHFLDPHTYKRQEKQDLIAPVQRRKLRCALAEGRFSRSHRQDVVRTGLESSCPNSKSSEVPRSCHQAQWIDGWWMAWANGWEEAWKKQDLLTDFERTMTLHYFALKFAVFKIETSEITKPDFTYYLVWLSSWWTICFLVIS